MNQLTKIVLCIVFITACSKDELNTILVSSEKELISFEFMAEDNTFLAPNTIKGVIDQVNKTITIGITENVDLKSLVPQISISENATILPGNKVPQDFSNPVIYQVTAPDESVTSYTVNVIPLSSMNTLRVFAFLKSNNPQLDFQEVIGDVDFENNNVTITLSHGIDITELIPQIRISEGATVQPDNLTVQNFTNPVVYTVTAMDGTKSLYNVIVKQPELSERDALIAFHDANPGVFNWNLEEDISTWEGVTVENDRVIGLNLSKDNFNRVPEEARNLLYIQNLSFGAALQGIDNFSHLTTLRSLSIFRSNLNELPSWVVNNLELETLFLAENKLSFLPSGFSSLSNLKLLLLRANEFITVPSELFQLTNLQELFLSENNLQSIPEELFNLTNLTRLDLRETNIPTLPSGISKLNNLRGLWLDNNQFSEIPSEITMLKNLNSLTIPNNNISEVPASISQMESLFSLNISFNKINNLPSELFGISKLSSLNASNNEIVLIPEEIDQAKELTSLNLSNNMLTQLPTSISKLENLEFLTLSKNQLTSIPSEIGLLTSLKNLNIRENQITTIPQIVCNLEDTGTSLFKDENVTCE